MTRFYWRLLVGPCSSKPRKFSNNLFPLSNLDNTKTFDETVKFKNSTISENNNLINKIETCIAKSYSCSTLKKESELKECLNDLKRYTSQLDQTTERLLNDKSWNFVIQNFSKQVDFEDLAIHWYKIIMVDKKIAKPNSFTLGMILKSLANISGELAMCEEIIEILKGRKACSLFSYTHYVNACIKNGELEKALNVIFDMKESGVEPNYGIFIPMLKAATRKRNLKIGLQVIEIINNSSAVQSIQVYVSVITFYLQLRKPEKAIEEFKKLQQNGLTNVITWTCLIQAYIQLNQVNKAIELINEMEKSGVKPNSTTFTILITACANNNLIEQGQNLHQLSLKYKNNTSIELSTTIMNFYTKCNQPEKAIEEFKKLQQNGLTNVITWTCLIQAYIQLNQVNKAIGLINEMEKNEVKPNSTTFTILITACANNNLIKQGQHLHQLSLITINEPSIELWNSIINFYIKCKESEKAIEEAKKIQKIGLMDVVTWTCLIQAYFQTGDIEMAIEIFEQMKREKVEPNIVTFTILLSGCGDFVSQNKGLLIIKEIESRRLDTSEEIISAMMNFYSKIGDQSNAINLLKTLKKKQKISPLSITTYNNMLSHYAHHGNGNEAKQLFDEMVKNRIQLQDQTFTIVLNAFSHCGMVNEAIKLFKDIELVHNHNPSLFIIAAMVDVYARSGQFKPAEKLIKNTRDFVLWNTLMGGCRKFNNIQLGERVFEKLISINSKDASPYILMSHIYTYHGLNEKADRIRQILDERGIKKIPGIVYHEENGQTYKFISGSNDYENYKETEKMRDYIYRLIIKAGYKPDTKWVTNSKLLTEQEKIDSLCKHAEKTAIAHAFVLNPNRKKILLTKNLRVCNDCHSATEYISKVMKVEIIVRDANRYHHFVNGKCSCGSYW